MKKKFKGRQTDMFVLEGASNESGVLMRFTMPMEDEIQGDVTISSSFSFPPVYAYVDNDGNISTDYKNGQEIASKHREEAKKDELKTLNVRAMAILTGIVSLIYAAYAMFSMKSIETTFKFLGICEICVAVSRTAQFLRDIFKRVKGDENFISFCRFHAAEHKILNAYLTLKRVPDEAELNQYSNYSNNCGYSYNAARGWIPLGVGIALLIPMQYSWIAALVYGIATIIMHFTGYVAFGALYVAKPTEKEIKVAHAAITEAVKNKEKSEIAMQEVISDLAKINVTLQMATDENGNTYPSGIVVDFGEESNPE